MKSSKLIEELYTSRQLLMSMSEPNEFIIAVIKEAIKELQGVTHRTNGARPRRTHSCDIPGCASCGNPEEGNWYDKDTDKEEDE